MEPRPQVAICAPALLDAGGGLHAAGGLPKPWRMIGRYLGLTDSGRRALQPGTSPQRTNWLCGAVQLARTPVIRELGGFDPRFFMYFEETDLGLRARRSGYELWTVGEVVGRHGGSASAAASGEQLSNHAIPRHFYQSRFYYFVKNHGWPWALAVEAVDLATTCLRMLIRALLGRPTEAQRSRLSAPFFQMPPRVAS
jgi:GT2 family glycosyltransferase